MENQIAVRITAYIPKEMKDKLELIAKKRYTNVSAIIKSLIVNEVEKG